MIIQELCRYYQRMQENPEIQIAEPGFSSEKIAAEIVLDATGKLVQFNDIRVQNAKKKSVPRELIVPQANSRPGVKSYEKPNFLWDTTAFVLGADGKDDEKALLKFDHFKKLHETVWNTTKDPALKLIVDFLKQWNPQDACKLENWEDLAGRKVVFRLDGQRQYLHQKALLRQIWLNYKKQTGNLPESYCLVSGKKDNIAKLHPLIKGVKAPKGSQSKDAAIVSFNAKAYESYGKEQNFNAPVGKDSAFAYTTALNYMLAPNSNRKIQIGDASCVYWTERESPIEGMLGQVFDPQDLESDDNADIRLFLEAIRDGKRAKGVDPDVKFYILGLSPNAARISIRFWYCCSVGQLEERIGHHYKELQMVRNFESDPEYPGIWRILRETVNKKATDKSSSPLLAGALAQSMLQGTAYPQGLFNAIINRIRADQEINYVRAAVLKACLNRNNRIYKKGMEVSVALDLDNNNQAYLLGRLFATLEKLQEEAHQKNADKVLDKKNKGIRSTIKSRYWGAASATPKVVFPQLMNLKNHHLAKLDNPDRVDFFNILFGEIVDDFESTGFKAHLTLDEQGLFTIGYYHQARLF